MDFIQLSTSYTCRNITNNNATESHPISSSREMTGGEHTGRAKKWVIVNKAICGDTVPYSWRCSCGATE